MALAGTILVALVLMIGTLNGLRRGAIKEGMALSGVLLGALLVTFWAERWGVVVSRRTGWRPGAGQLVAALSLLWGTALLAGYGSAALLPRRTGKLSISLRAAGALLGLFNAGLLLAFTLRYVHFMYYATQSAVAARNPGFPGNPALQFLLNRLDLILLSMAWGFAVVSLVVTLIRLTMRLIAPQPPSLPAIPSRTEPVRPQRISDTPIMREPGASSPTPTPPGMERSFLEKPRPPTGGSTP